MIDITFQIYKLLRTPVFCSDFEIILKKINEFVDTIQAFEARFQSEKPISQRLNRIENIRHKSLLAEKNILKIIELGEKLLQDYKILKKIINLMDKIDQQVHDLQEESNDVEKLSKRDDVYDSYYLNYLRERLGIEFIKKNN